MKTKKKKRFWEQNFESIYKVLFLGVKNPITRSFGQERTIDKQKLLTENLTSYNLSR